MIVCVCVYSLLCKDMLVCVQIFSLHKHIDTRSTFAVIEHNDVNSLNMGVNTYLYFVYLLYLVMWLTCLCVRVGVSRRPVQERERERERW